MCLMIRFKKLTFLCLIYIVGFNFCRADLGETFDQMIKRYGDSAPSKSYYLAHPTDLPYYTFTKDKYVIEVHFDKGIVSDEIISKDDKSDFTDEEIANILKNNQLEKQEWKGPVINSYTKTWERQDGATVDYDTKEHFVIVEIKQP
jgi:hypothetical protein